MSKKLDLLEQMALLDAEIVKEYGKDAIIDLNRPLDIERVQSNIPLLDEALGGGWPRGRIIDVYGDYSIGKSTLCLDTMIQFQKQTPNKFVAWFDSESAGDLNYAEYLGLDKSRLKYSTKDEMEETMDIMYKYAKSGLFSVIVLDSLDALMPQKLLDEGLEANDQGSKQKKFKQFLNTMKGICSKTQTNLVTVNQIYSATNVSYGNPNKSTGGRSVKFLSSIRVELSRLQFLEQDGNQYGHTVKAFIEKNKTYIPRQQATFDIIWGKGIDKVGNLVEACVGRAIIKKSGAWFEVPGQKQKLQGISNVVQLVREDDRLYKQLNCLYKKELDDVR